MAREIASGVISWKTMRWVGTLGLSSSTRCQAMASPSRSSSVARRSSSASFSRLLSLDTCWRLPLWTTYSASKLSSTLTPSLAHGSPRYLAGISAALSGMSRMWPTLDSTTYPRPRYPAMVRALDGDSTMTSVVPWPSADPALAFAPPVLAPAARGLLPVFAFVVVVLGGTLFPSLLPRHDHPTVPSGHGAEARTGRACHQ